MNIYDPELILSWTPHEYSLFIKGSQHRQIDRYEEITHSALANAKAQNSKKRVRPKDIFDAEKARRKLEGKEDREAKRMVRMNHIFKGFVPDFKPKGG